MGSLDLNRVSSYFAQVTCTDDVDPDVSTTSIEVRVKANSPPTFTDPASGLGESGSGAVQFNQQTMGMGWG